MAFALSMRKAIPPAQRQLRTATLVSMAYQSYMLSANYILSANHPYLQPEG